MASVQSVACCCLLWLMLPVQLITPGSPGTAQLSGHRTARVPPPDIMAKLCPDMCNRDSEANFVLRLRKETGRGSFIDQKAKKIDGRATAYSHFQ